MFVGLLALPSFGADVYRRPMGANTFYPASPAQLKAALEQYRDAADPVELPGRYVGCMVPHSRMNLSGGVTAAAFKHIEPGQYDRVIVLSPAHTASFRGCSIPKVTHYVTPLGKVPLDEQAIRRLDISSLFTLRSLVYRRSAYTDPNVMRRPVHEVEHGIEVVLPFLQERLGSFELVPVLVGEFKTVTGEPDNRGFGEAIQRIASLIDDRTLVVASVELTRYGQSYGYVPFTDNVQSGLTKLDMDAIKLIQNRDLAGLQEYMGVTGNKLFGVNALVMFMGLLPDTSQGFLLDYDTSGRMANDFEKSTSFASIGFIDLAEDGG
jgi:hypothetical protein